MYRTDSAVTVIGWSIKDIMYQRSIEPVRRQSKDPHQLVIRVLSYNVLADHLLWLNKELYDSCPPEALVFDYRKYNIIHNILEHDPSVSELASRRLRI